MRIENLLLAIDKGESAFGRFMAFETLTLCPIDLDCLRVNQMTDAEVRWIDRYHATVREALLPEFAATQDERARRARQWLLDRTRPVLR